MELCPPLSCPVIAQRSRHTPRCTRRNLRCGIHSNTDEHILRLAHSTKTSRVLVNQPQVTDTLALTLPRTLTHALARTLAHARQRAAGALSNLTRTPILTPTLILILTSTLIPTPTHPILTAGGLQLGQPVERAEADLLARLWLVGWHLDLRQHQLAPLDQRDVGVA